MQIAIAKQIAKAEVKRLSPSALLGTGITFSLQLLFRFRMNAQLSAIRSDFMVIIDLYVDMLAQIPESCAEQADAAHVFGVRFHADAEQDGILPAFSQAFERLIRRPPAVDIRSVCANGKHVHLAVLRHGVVPPNRILPSPYPAEITGTGKSDHFSSIDPERDIRRPIVIVALCLGAGFKGELHPLHFFSGSAIEGSIRYSR